MTRVVRLLLPSSLCLAPAALAAPVEPLSAAQLLRAALSLALVLGVILLCAWLLRRFGGVRLRPSQRLQVLASTPLGQRERVALVEADGRRLLLGVAPGSVSLLCDYGTERDAGTAAVAAERVER